MYAHPKLAYFNFAVERNKLFGFNFIYLCRLFCVHKRIGSLTFGLICIRNTLFVLGYNYLVNGYFNSILPFCDWCKKARYAQYHVYFG